jgi:hypothetical protein
LQKTVGTNPAACATTDVITVTAGTDVTYCYEVTNSGGITLNTHDLFDDQLGPLLSFFHYELAPGASAFLTQTTPIAVTTTNVATWTAYEGFFTVTAQTADSGGGQGIAFSSSDTCLVNVLALPPSEPGAGPDGCIDGIDNDQDGATDCGDTDCVGIGPCASPAPVLSPGGFVIAGLILLSIGAGSLLRRRQA